jgi:hypothetical protein
MYYSSNEVLAKRQLESQSLKVNCNLVAATSDLPSKLTIANGTIGATVVTLQLGEEIEKVQHVQVHNKATGAILAFGVAPAIASSSTITFTVDGTAQTSLSVIYHYVVK